MAEDMELLGLGGGDSDSENGGPPAGGEGAAQADGSSNESDYSIDEHDCLGCDVTSRKMCPISVLRQARYRKKPFHNKKTGVIRKRKAPSGRWCGNCFNFWRSNFKKEVPNLEDFEDITREKPHLKAKWKKMNGNYIRAKGGGKSRVRNGKPKRVSKRTSVRDQLVDGGVYFYTPSAYKRKFGCPKENKAKPHTVKKKDGTLLHGYAVRHGEEGVFQLNSIVENETVLEESLLNQEEQLHEEHAEEALGLVRGLTDSGVLARSNSRPFPKGPGVGSVGQPELNQLVVIKVRDMSDNPQEAAAASGPTVQLEKDVIEMGRLADLRKRAADQSAALEQSQASSESDDGKDDKDGEESEDGSVSASNSDSDACSGARPLVKNPGTKKAAAAQPPAKKSKTSAVTASTAASTPKTSRKSVGGSSAAGSVRSGSAPPKDDKIAAHAKELLHPLEVAYVDFIAGKWAAYNPRPLSQMLKDIVVAINAANRFLKAKGSKQVGADAEIEKLQKHVEAMTAISGFKKYWTKFQGLDATTAYQQQDAVKAKLIAGAAMPPYIAKIVIDKKVKETEDLEGQLGLIEDTNTVGGIGMLPAEEQAGHARALLLKVMSSFLDSMKTINDYDEGEAKFKGLVTAVLNRTSLPKPAVDDMKAINVYFIWKDKAVDSSNVAPMKSGVQAAVARLTQKKDSSCYLALLKRKKPAPYEMAVKGLTDMMKTVQQMEQKSQATAGILKAINKATSTLPSIDQKSIEQHIEKFIACVSECKKVNWKETNSDEVAEAMVTFMDRIAASIMFQVPSNVATADEDTQIAVVKWVGTQARLLTTYTQMLHGNMPEAKPLDEIPGRNQALQSWCGLLEYLKWFNVDAVLGADLPVDKLNIALSKMSNHDIKGLAQATNSIGVQGNVPYPIDLLDIIKLTIEVDREALTFLTTMNALGEFHKILPAPLCSVMKALIDIQSNNDGDEQDPITIEDHELLNISLNFAGHVDIPEELVTRVTADDVHTVLGKLDMKVGVAIVFNELKDKFSLSEGAEASIPSGDKSKRVPFLMKLLPALRAVIALDGYDKVSGLNAAKLWARFWCAAGLGSKAVAEPSLAQVGLQGNDQNNLFKNYNEKERDLTDLQVWMESASSDVLSDAVRANLSKTFKSWDDAKRTKMYNTLEAIANKIEAVGKSIGPNLIDTKSAMKNFEPEQMQIVKEMPGRQSLINAVKTMGETLTTWRLLASPVGGNFSVGEKSVSKLEEKIQEAIVQRGKAKSTIAVRSAFCILLSKDAALVSNYMVEMRNAKTTIPQKLKKQLEALQQQAGGTMQQSRTCWAEQWEEEIVRAAVSSCCRAEVLDSS
ncbi:unnamed protein product [Prorocentrum cordatum]|uniref:Uncharacterized protein n=1 Tax=Prorocentrum cordatum TaxID=2364126 RepID=A0ABN9R6Q1_9DINO|nr:unnamed protein product [Polarella glacialis]